MEVEKSTSEKIERPGKEDINVKYADNTGKKPETAKAPVVASVVSEIL